MNQQQNTFALKKWSLKNNQGSADIYLVNFNQFQSVFKDTLKNSI